MTQPYRLALCLLLFGVVGFADSVPAFTPQEFDSASWLMESTAMLLRGSADLFVDDAWRWHRNLGSAMLTLVGVNLAWESFGGRWHLAPAPLRAFLFWYLVSGVILNHWDSFRHIFIDQSIYMQARIKFGTLSEVSVGMNAIQANMPHPEWWDVPAAITHGGIIAALSVVGALFDIMSSFGIVAMGVGGVIGPFFILALPFPRFQSWSWGYIAAMIKYAFYGVVGCCFVNIFAGFLMHYLDNSVHGLYTAEHMTALFGSLIKVSIMTLYALLQIPHVVSDFTSGAASAGAGLGQMMLSVAGVSRK